MISMRSAISRRIIGGRSASNTSAAFLQSNLAFPSPSSFDDESKSNQSSPSVRTFVSPAYRRHLNRDQFLNKNIRGLKPSIGAKAPGIQVPTLEVAKDMGRSFSEMENEPLLIIAEMGSHSARCEVLKRHIMAVDAVEYEKAEKQLDEIAEKSLEGLAMYALPYKIGITVAMISGFGAIPMVFSVNTAMAFNEVMVTMEVPVPSDLDTVLETGAWTWNWMEPLTGTLSFSLLCMQFARQQILNLGIKPFTKRVLHKRSVALKEIYPQYNARLLAGFVESFPMNGKDE